MTTEEGLGVTEVVTTTTVLDLKEGRNENLICTCVRTCKKALWQMRTLSVPDYKHSSGSKASNDKVWSRTNNVCIRDEDRLTGYTVQHAQSSMVGHRDTSGYAITAKSS